MTRSSTLISLYIKRRISGLIDARLAAYRINKERNFNSLKDEASIWDLTDLQLSADSLRSMEQSNLDVIRTHITFLEAVRIGNVAHVRAIIDNGLNVNFQNPENGMTALHIAASTGNRDLVRLLTQQDGLMFCVKDARKQMPSTLALAFGGDPVIARYLAIKERSELSQEGTAPIEFQSLDPH